MSIAWSWNEMSLAWIGLVLYAMSAKQFARNSWGRLTKDCNLTQVENSKVSCMETELSGAAGGGTITKPWEGYSRSSMAQSHLLQLPRGGGLGRFDLIHPEQQCSGSITSSTWQGSDAMKLQHCCPESEHLGRGSVLSLLQYLLPEHLLLDFRAQAAMWKATLLTGKGQRQP